MIQSKRSSDSYAYLMDNKNSRTRNVVKRLGTLLSITALCALGIWMFTPVSEEVNYKLDYASKGAQFDDSLTDSTQIEGSPQSSGKPLEISVLAGAPEQLPEVDSAHSDLLNSMDPLATIELPENEPMPEDAEAVIGEAVAGPEPRSLDELGDSRLETFTIEAGDTLTRIFSRANLPISQAINLSKQEAADQLNRLSIGKELRIFFDANDQWETLEYTTSKLDTLIVTLAQGEFSISQHQKQVTYRIFAARGTIESSLGAAAENADVSATIAQNLVDIYKWEIDFARDLRQGDTFSVVYQKAYIDDEWVADDAILAASFTSGGRVIDAVRYTDSEGITAYFQPDGESLRRGFLRTPVKLARITSGFGKRRHPIKKVWKKHLGVDYGARRGAPVLSTADGVVQFSGNKGGYGKTVILRHGGIYTTLYAHLSKMGKGIRPGKAVTQGQVIGYVGSTGWATGDHLHYEFRVNGQHKNPLKVELPKTLPLASREMDAFADHAEPLLDTLTSLKAAQLAINEPIDSRRAL